MSQRKLSLLMMVCSLIGGVIGFVVGEVILSRLSTELPQWLLMGLYFGQYALFVGLMCLVAEMISPRLNGHGWKQRYVGASWKMLVPSTLVMVGVAAMLLQLLYGFSYQRSSGTDNIVMLLDTSDSMKVSDPSNQLFQAASDVVRKMDSDMQIAVITFNDQTEVLQPLVQLSDQSVKDTVIAKLQNHPGPSGGTQIDKALRMALEQLQASQQLGPNSTVVLMSDGYSNVDLQTALAPYKQANMHIHTVGMSQIDADGTYLMKRISEETGGTYFNVDHAEELSGIFGQIYELSRQDRNLVTERTGAIADSTFFAIIRVLGILIIGGLLGLALGLIFDNRHLAKSFTIGGAAAGLPAGLLLESALTSSEWLDTTIRLVALALMAVVMTLFTAFVPASADGGQTSFKSRLGQGKRSPQRMLESGSRTSKRFDL
ncbi:vWA domain-containing protein [Brevibacillus choshinensis]|uniref:VWA domain-containing protein n=1 Tax=Brevibacillus choshinensis TaxID=54911 RepID=A0ABX7FPC0_BRECH|nr:vWA domain-containing protein [Brevibacillus choshinensis]QRG67598.1 VWA domain-containing protein [Brevibacillus choshinensis]